MSNYRKGDTDMSQYKDFIYERNTTLKSFINDIKVNGEIELEVQRMRDALPHNKMEYNRAKKKLPAVTGSGTFYNGSRNADSLKMYNGIMVLDLDGINPDDITYLKDLIMKQKSTIACFVSPSGRGLKILVNVRLNHTKDFQSTYKVVQKHYEEVTGAKIDDACKDVTRLCFSSHDPDIRVNYEAEEFIVPAPSNEVLVNEVKKLEYSPMEKFMRADEELRDKAYFTARKWAIESKGDFEEGNRHNFMCYLVFKANQTGVPKNYFYDYVERGRMMWDEAEVKRIIEDCYKKHESEYGKYQLSWGNFNPNKPQAEELIKEAEETTSEPDESLAKVVQMPNTRTDEDKLDQILRMTQYTYEFIQKMRSA